ncbi:MAG: D-alanyl-D-alanine carboxypeptidase [Solirubrobacterales bacterium]|nr:D-alanyl-D-alanine carboxypeptidase [Solirubrobacterales bacterium]MBV9808341.1 D-alanyl-D-alanine carboxypeptidase [Solirubrobacterales bacterium]
MAALAIAGCGGGGHAAKPSADAAVGRPVTAKSTTGTVPRVAPAVPRNTPTIARPLQPSAAVLQLQAALTKSLNKAGANTGALVYDLTAKQTLFALRPNAGRPPASVEKLYTTVALLSELGPNARLKTTVVGTGHLGPGGIWQGNLYLVGGGDPTFGDGGFNQVWEQGYGPSANDLVAQLRRVGIRRVTGWVIGDAALFDGLPGGPATAYGPDVPDFGGQLAALTYDHGSTFRRLNPGAFAAKELVLTMHDAGIGARPLNRTLPAPPGGRQLASVQSPPLSVLLALMDVPSDDFFAEMLTKQLGVRFGGAGSIQAGAHVISQVIESFGLHPAIIDGSGLSRDDRSSPGQVVALLRTMWGTSIGRGLVASLPTVGVNGTVQGIAAHSAARGRCAAKTGTLNYVTNLAGYCTALGNHVLAFAVMMDGPPNWTADKLLGQMLPAIARY